MKLSVCLTPIWKREGPDFTGGYMRLKTGTVLAIMTAMAVMVDHWQASQSLQLLSMFAVGLVYACRDYLQALVGDYAVMASMVLVALVAYIGSDNPHASANAFVVGQAMAWSVFTQMRGVPFHKRMMVSSIVACVVDSSIYLGITGGLEHLAVFSALKIVPVIVVFLLVRNSILCHPMPR